MFRLTLLSNDQLKEGIFKLTQYVRELKNIKLFYTIEVVYHKSIDIDTLSDPPVTHRSSVFSILDQCEDSNLTNTVFNQLMNEIEQFQRNGSGWVINTINHIDIAIVSCDPLRASSYLPLPEEILLKNACVNIKNDDEFCFLWSVLAHLYPANEFPERLYHYRKYIDTLNTNGLTFPMTIPNI